MEVDKVERYVNDLMTVSGIEREGKEQSVGLALYHLLMSAALRDMMDDDEKELFKALAKRLQYFFCSNLNLKERKRNKEKKSLPPHPLLKEKEKKEKEEKNIDIAGGEKLALSERREAFRKECEGYVESFDRQRLEDFFYYWAEEVKGTSKMLFELKKSWNTYYRLRRWMNTKYSVENTAAAIRMKRLQKQQAKEQSDAEKQRAQAAERQQKDAEREAQTERDKQQAGGLEEFIKNNPDSKMARIAREREAREARKGNKKGSA